MSEQSAYSNTTEAVGVFHTKEDLQDAVDDLLSQGFARMDLSILASEKAIEEKLHEAYVPVRELEDRVGVPTTAFVSRDSYTEGLSMLAGVMFFLPAMLGGAAMVASGGTLAAAIAASVIGGGVGGTIGAITASILGVKHAQEIEGHLMVGGLLLWVRTKDKQHEERALGILAGHSGESVHLHTLPSLLKAGCSLPTEDVVESNSAKTMSS